MSEVVLKIENVCKQYRLGLVGTGTLGHDLKRWWYLVRGKDDPYLQIGEVNDTEVKGGQYVNALSAINLEIKKGEVVGIIGKNGAGKSTLLKLLSEVTNPTTGSIKVKGKIAALLEVGTGFHPELTGRENIFLNGAILGMNKKEIDSRIEEIIDFSGVAKYIDTPVKRYSSGMKVRLGFAVAAHLDPEILIVDEVLAVGDIAFQNKCISKMESVAKDGKTVIVVSHNMSSITRMCSRAILLENGTVVKSGEVDTVVQYYISGDKFNNAEKKWIKNAPEGGGVALNSIKVTQDLNTSGSLVNDIEKDIYLQFNYTLVRDKSIYCGFFLSGSNGSVTFISSDFYEVDRFNKVKGTYSSICKIPGNILAEETYFIRAFIAEPVKDAKPIIHIDLKDVLSFQVIDNLTGNSARKSHIGSYPGAVRPILKWSLKDV